MSEGDTERSEPRDQNGPSEIVRKENRHGVMKDYVRTDIGTTVVETSKRIHNPVTERTEDLTNLSADGYCRRFLALLSASSSPDVIDLGSAPVLTFDKDRWELQEHEDQHVLVKRDAESKFGEQVLGNAHEVEAATDKEGSR